MSADENRRFARVWSKFGARRKLEREAYDALISGMFDRLLAEQIKKNLTHKGTDEHIWDRTFRTSGQLQPWQTYRKACHVCGKSRLYWHTCTYLCENQCVPEDY